MIGFTGFDIFKIFMKIKSKAGVNPENIKAPTSLTLDAYGVVVGKDERWISKTRRSHIVSAPNTCGQAGPDQLKKTESFPKLRQS